MIVERMVNGVVTAHEIAEVDEKLVFRASLPGAFGWDQAAHVARALQAEGVHGADLLPLVFPTSWMVNARATSRAFQRWLLPPSSAAWEELLDRLPPSTSLVELRETDEALRARVQALVSDLAAIEDAGLAAVTKVLALLRPQLVPLMDDAAIWFALGAVEEPKAEGTKQAEPALFWPMIEWFAREVARNEAELVAAAARHRHAVLDAPQVLDRLLWMESWGERHRR